ncbi:MAG: aminotransferase class I/II-fold pyridoxal phosphate-dependent enzyme, partial [Odoribacter sp.]|nr:aminotransferase class I/II-fold pyridoxal phosphate-dependent enzyme [Odoribacter sp.]
GYPTYTSAARLAEAVPYDLREENGWWPDFRALEEMDLSGVKMMWTNYPHMPTGARADEGLYRWLAEFGRRHGILVCNDNPYSFVLNDERLSILAAEGAKECCVELNSLSKAHNMSGWRVGMVAGTADVVEQVLKVKSNMDSGMFRPLQLAAVKALGQGDAWYEELNGEYRRRRRLAGEIFDWLGVRYDGRSGGLFLWGRVGERWKDEEELSDYVLREAGVFLTPGFVFGRNGREFVRISLCAPVEVLEEALERLQGSVREKFSHGSFC